MPKRPAILATILGVGLLVLIVNFQGAFTQKQFVLIKVNLVHGVNDSDIYSHRSRLDESSQDRLA